MAMETECSRSPPIYRWWTPTDAGKRRNFSNISCLALKAPKSLRI